MRRAFLCALLIYVALDLSLPELPGAFVFDLDGSVDSIGAGRARPSKIVDLPKPSTDPSVRLPEVARDAGPRRARIGDAVYAARLVVSCLPRASCGQPQPSEDPH